MIKSTLPVSIAAAASVGVSALYAQTFPSHASPTEVEGEIFRFLSTLNEFEITSILLVNCSEKTWQCQIHFTGSDSNPSDLGEYSGLSLRMLVYEWNSFNISQGGMGLYDIAPAARGYAMGFSYAPYENLSEDPVVAAHQHANCAASRLRVLEQAKRLGDRIDTVSVKEQARMRMALAEKVLGEREATRILEESKQGPIVRDCSKPPA
jgi:hypothetical protein